MNRRELLKYMGMLGSGVLMGNVANAVLAGAPLHTPPTTRALSDDQRALVALLSERIIPTTDTPGAITAGVPAFIERMVGEWYTPTERKIFVDGLIAFEGYCHTQHNKPAAACDAQQLDSALQFFEAQAKQYQHPPAASIMGDVIDENAPFFSKLKELTVLGYYTSEVGTQQELRYEPMPMSYEGDVTLAPDDRAWSNGGLLR